MKKKYFKSNYDCIIIGSALAGMTAALRLSKLGFENVLILERQKTPGGVTTSFVRNGTEFEASLHEMSGVSSKKYPLAVRKFLDEFNIHINWKRIDTIYRYVEPGFSCTIHAGEGQDYSIPIEDILSAVKDDTGTLRHKLELFFGDIKNVFDSINALGDGRILETDLLPAHLDLLRSLSYSTEEVINVYEFPPVVKRILLAYWAYIGNEPKDLPYILYCCLIGDYIGHGAYTCEETSYEISLKMLETCRKKGIQVEFGQDVDKILVKDDHVIGVSLKDSTTLFSNYVISGSYPNSVYNKMIEPPNAVKKEAFQFLNSKQIGMTVFSVILLLDKPKEQLNLNTYMTLYAKEGLDFDKIMESYHSDHDFKYTTSVCMNVINPQCSRKGTTVYSITALPYPDCFKNVTEDNYDEMKHRIAKELIEMESDRLGFSLFDHILEIEYITPVSIAHYCKSYRGCIYGYIPSLDDNVAVRVMKHKDEFFIPGLAFAGAHQVSGDGMGTQFINGNQAAQDILYQFKNELPSALRQIISPDKKKKKKNDAKKIKKIVKEMKLRKQKPVS